MTLNTPKGDYGFERLVTQRRDRLQATMSSQNMSACLLFHPANIRYATGTSVMEVHTLGATERYCLMPASGEPILFEWEMAVEHSKALVDDVRPALWWQYQGEQGDILAGRFADEIKVALRDQGVDLSDPIGIDRADAIAVLALQAAGITLVSASKVTDRARLIKTPEEVALLRINGEIGCAMLAEFEQAIQPGVREYELLATLSDALMRRQGTVVFTRLVSSGGRTNPWGQEASDKVVEVGDLVALDTDANGYEGYVIDVSRTFLCSDSPTDEQRTLFRVAHDRIMAMREAVRPGLSYADYARAVPLMPDVLP